MNHRRQFSAEFKARVAREALKEPKAPSRAEEQKTIAELAADGIKKITNEPFDLWDFDRGGLL